MFELSLLCPEGAVETISDALDSLDALSVSVEDADADTDAEQALFGEPGLPPPRAGWQHSRVVALFSNEALAREAAQLLQAQDFFAHCEVAGINPVPEQDWVRLTQSQFTPVPITPSFWIVPTWHEPPQEAKVSIRLDPGLAFGTGQHPTTRMCLRWLAAHPPQGQRVLDYGCGSGILAVGAAKFGAVQVDAVDIDPAAVQATEDNAKANSVDIQAGLPDRVDPADSRYQTVLANILASPLTVLAPLLCAHVAPGGKLVLAGILERQIGQLQLAYSPWLDLAVSDAEDGWVLMTGCKPLPSG
ncbi:MAG: 50S ribosomal protein L11 methyltransferase [Burkholderiaceae bacterium]